MSNFVTASWYGKTEYTPPAGDEVTASWFGSGPEMPLSPLTLSFVLNQFDAFVPLELAFSFPSGAFPLFSFGVDDPLTFELLLGYDIPAYRIAPKQAIPGYSSDGTSITLPIASLVGLSSAEADAATGDWREVLQAILLRAVEYHKTWVWSDQTRAYEPFVMNLLNSRTFDRHFLVHFLVNTGEPNVAPEP